MSGCYLQSSEQERAQDHLVIPRFNYESWVNKVDEDIERRDVRSTGNVLEDIINTITSKRYRRGSRRFFETNREDYQETISNDIQNNRPLEFVLPSFPVKCFNPLKVRRNTPDLAEIGCLSKLYSLCKDIEQIYQPGARIVLVTDGLVYAPIFREPIVHAQIYREKVDTLIGELGFEGYINSIDMSNLIDSNQEEFDRTYREVERQLAHNWEENPNNSDRVRLIENTMTNINLTMYSEEDLINVFVNNNNHQLEEEIREKSIDSAFEYLAFNQTIREMGLLEKEFPQSSRITCHEKEGQLGLHLVHPRSFNFPWNGVGVLRENGTVRVEFEHEARRNPNYFAVYIEGENHPFYFQNR